MSSAWRVGLMEDDTGNDSDKIFTVPASTEWEILWIWVKYISTSTVGFRQVEIQMQNSAGTVIGRFQTGAKQRALLTYNYLFGVATPDLSVVRDTNYLMTPLPAATFLSAGQKIRIWDNKMIAVSSDDMTIKIQYGYHGI